MRVLALDVGLTTGVVLADARGYKDLDILIASDVKGHDALIDYLWSMLPSYDLDVLIYEDFRVYEHKAKALTGSALPASVSIGITLAAHRTLKPELTLVTQMASERSYVKQAGILPSHKPMFKGLHHARDAYYHIRTYLLKQRNKRK